MTSAAASPVTRAWTTLTASPTLAALSAGTLALVLTLAAVSGAAPPDSSLPDATGEAGSRRVLSRCLVLDGASALRVDVPLADHDDLTLEAWVCADAGVTDGTVFGNAGFGGVSFEWKEPALRLETPSAWVNTEHVPGTRARGYAIAQLPEPLEADRWYHVAVVVEADQMRLFVDGTCRARATALGARRESSRPFVIGGRTTAAGALTSTFRGRVDDLRISKGALYRESFEPPVKAVAERRTLGLFEFETTTPFMNAVRRGIDGVEIGRLRTEAAPRGVGVRLAQSR